MKSDAFDAAIQFLAGIPTRRGVLRGLAGLGFGLTTIRFSFGSSSAFFKAH